MPSYLALVVDCFARSLGKSQRLREFTTELPCTRAVCHSYYRHRTVTSLRERHSALDWRLLSEAAAFPCF